MKAIEDNVGSKPHTYFITITWHYHKIILVEGFL